MLARNLSAIATLGTLALVGAWKHSRSTLGLVAIAAIAPTVFFNAYWLGSDPQFWLPVFPFIILLAAKADCFGWIARAPRLRPALWGAVLATLFLTNVATIGPPTLLRRMGDSRWTRAEALSGWLPPGALILRPGVGDSPLQFLREFRPDVEILNLAYSPPSEATGDSLLSWVAGTVDERLSAGHDVWLEGMADILPVRLLGSWTYTTNRRTVTRDEYQSFINARNRQGRINDDLPLVQIKGRRLDDGQRNL